MKGIAPLAALAVIGLLIVVLAGSNVIKLPAEYVVGEQCKWGETLYYTLRCEASGNPVVTERLFDGNSYTIQTKDTIISKVSTNIGSLENIPTGYSFKVSSPSGIICEVKYTGGLTGTWQDTCSGKSLITGQTYTFSQTTPPFMGPNTDVKAYIAGRPLMLKLYDSTGIYGLDIPYSVNCVSNDWTLDSTVKLPWAANTTRSVSMQEGQTQIIAYAYKEIAPLTTNTYNGQPAICNQNLKRIEGFAKVNDIYGNCWRLKDSGTILLDGSGYREFCCSDDICRSYYGHGTDWSCVNYQCVKSQIGTQQCRVTSDCAPIQTWFTEQTGQVIQIDRSCISGICKETRTQVACDPTKLYPNNMCCKRNAQGVLTLEPCTAPLKDCAQSFGKTACCTAKQKEYTIKLAENYCCDKDGDGIGYNTINEAACNGNTGINGCDIFCMIGRFFANLIGGFIIGLIILIILVILAAAGILPFLRFLFNPAVFFAVLLLIAVLLAFTFTGMTATVAQMVIG